LATTDVILNYMFRAINESNTTTPTNSVISTRAEMLEILNQLYQNEIGKRLNLLASYSYDASDADHTITDGVGALPSDFLTPHLMYDGDAVDNLPLTQIYDINDKVDDDADTTQFMIPNNTQFWIFGKTPTNTIKLYYYQKPAALTDSSSSSPTDLKSEFHINIFQAKAKEEYARRRNRTDDMIDAMAMVEDYLNQIAYAHSVERQDAAPRTIRDVYGGL
jgi:hypothetical protein